MFCLSKRQRILRRGSPLSQTQELQDKVNSLNYDPETVTTSGLSHIPTNPREFRVPEMFSRDSGMPQKTRNSTDSSGYVFEDPLVPKMTIPIILEDPKYFDVI